MNSSSRAWLILVPVLATLSAGCVAPRPGAIEPRRGDEIVVAGQFVHTGTRVVLWMDPGGYDAYRVERRFSPFNQSDWTNSQAADTNLARPNRYGLRQELLTAEQIERVRGGGWDLLLLQQVIDQFVIHYDAEGTSRRCFEILQDHRGLSVHFLLDLDGTIYQTLDVKERALHAGSANTRSVGVEIANIGAYPVGDKNPFAEWYQQTNSQTVVTIPKRFGDGGLLATNFTAHPARPDPVHGQIQGSQFVQYDFTPQQYESLAHLVATLCRILPKIECKFPAEANGRPVMGRLPDDDLANFHGILGHYHLTASKVDPGPAFNWELLINEARHILHPSIPATPAAKHVK
jgi:N-acetyl-anhydromuramyl-L-alanine amidase AmpD